jgi:hypothetical protein
MRETTIKPSAGQRVSPHKKTVRKPETEARCKPYLPSDPLTVLEAKVEVQPGDTLYIRGDGAGLSWKKGQPLTRGFGGRWIWTHNQVKGFLVVRLLLNDRVWERGREIALEAGKMFEVAPAF